MKRYLLIISMALFASSSIFAHDWNGDSQFSWETNTVELGTIAQGEPVTVVFPFKNISDKEIVLSQVKGSCGCTVAEFEKAPIAPGETSEISATYNASKEGVFTKTVLVQTLDGEKFTLYLKGEVTKA